MWLWSGADNFEIIGGAKRQKGPTGRIFKLQKPKLVQMLCSAQFLAPQLSVTGCDHPSEFLKVRKMLHIVGFFHWVLTTPLEVPSPIFIKLGTPGLIHEKCWSSMFQVMLSFGSSLMRSWSFGHWSKMHFFKMSIFNHDIKQFYDCGLSNNNMSVIKWVIVIPPWLYIWPFCLKWLNFISSPAEVGGVLGRVGLKYNYPSLWEELYLRPTPPSTRTFQLDLV